MKYMLLIYQAPDAIPTEERDPCYVSSAALARELHAAGKLHSAHPLKAPTTATSIRPQGTKRVLTDGPFAETREQLAGYYMVEVDNLDEAVEIGKRVPGGAYGTVEVRPVHPIEGLPTD